MRKSTIVVVLVLTVFLFLVVACGGGGGGDSHPSSSLAAPAIPHLVCPDGSSLPLASGTGACPAVALLAGSAAYTNVDPRTLTRGIIVQHSGTLDSTSVTASNVVLTKGTTTVPSTVSLSADKMDIFDVPTQWLAYGQTYSLTTNIKDSVERGIQSTVPITTAVMTCSDNKVWSTPATFSPTYQDCISPVGVQAKVTIFNKLQDDTCVVTNGVALTSECKNYFANGTMLLSDTAVIVGGHPTMWMFYVNTADASDIVLLDVHDPTNPVPIDTLALSSPVSWQIGNPSGLSVHTADGKGYQLTVGLDKKIVSTQL